MFYKLIFNAYFWVSVGQSHNIGVIDQLDATGKNKKHNSPFELSALNYFIGLHSYAAFLYEI